jgi:hypothetical protein
VPPARQIVQFPEEIKPFCEKLDAATDDGSRIDATVQTLFFLNRVPDWKIFTENMLTASAQNDQETALEKHLKPLLSTFVAGGLIRKEVGQGTLDAFRVHWAEVHAVLLQKMQSVGAIVPPAAPVAVQAEPVAEVVEAAPAEEESDEEEESEPDDGPQIIDLPPDMDEPNPYMGG